MSARQTRLGAAALVALLGGGCQVLKRAGIDAPALDRANMQRLAATANESRKCEGLRDPLVPIQEEYALGGMVAARWVQNGGGLFLEGAGAAEVSRYLNQVGKNLGAQSGRPGLDWTFGVLETADVNAYSSPGGYVLVTRGLLRRLENEAQLAGVLAHEIAHITERHALGTYASVKANQCQTALGTRVAASAAEQASQDAFRKATGADGAFLDLDKSVDLLRSLSDKVVEDLTTRGFGKDDEDEADRVGLALAMNAGYSPTAYLDFLAKLPAGGGKAAGLHAPGPDRQQALRKWLDQKPRAGEFDERPAGWQQLPKVPFKGQLDAAVRG